MLKMRREEGYADEQIFVIVLPQSANVDLPESVWNLPENSECRDNDNMFRCDKEDFKPKPHCKKCDRLKERFKDRTLFIHKELSEWLYDSVEKNEINTPKEELRLNGKSLLDQLSVVETKKQEVEELEQQLNDLQRAITKEYLDVILRKTTCLSYSLRRNIARICPKWSQ